MNRIEAPSLKEIDKINFIEPRKVLIGNIAPFYSIENHGSDAARIELFFKAGTIIDRPVLASLCSGLLLAGTSKETATEIHNNIDDLGGFFDINLSQEHTVVSVYALNDQIIPLLTIVMDAMHNASFPEAEIEEQIADKKQRLRVSYEKVNFLCQRDFQKRLFEGTNYAKVTEIEDYDSVTRAEIIDFFNSYFRKGLLKATLVGRLQEEQLREIEQLLAPWAGKEVTNNTPIFKQQKGNYHIEKTATVQTGIRIGRMMFDRKQEDYHGFVIMNTIFGDYFGSRLMKNIREDKGYTYGIGSALAEMKDNGYFIIGTEVGAEVAAATLKEIQYEMTQMKDQLVDKEELELVRNYLLGQALKSADGPFAMMDLFLGVEMHGLDYSFYNEALKKLKLITAEEIQSLAKKYLVWEEMLVITAGQQLID